jgi:hypothetical protein
VGAIFVNTLRTLLTPALGLFLLPGCGAETSSAVRVERSAERAVTTPLREKAAPSDHAVTAKAACDTAGQDSGNWRCSVSLGDGRKVTCNVAYDDKHDAVLGTYCDSLP